MTDARTVLSKQALEVFRSVGKSADRFEQQLTGFLPMKGKLYDGKLMVVGRAVNGWTRKGFYASDLAKEEHLSSYVDMVWDSVSASSSCDMEWVTENWNQSEDCKTNRSSFWRVIRRSVATLGIADTNDDHWPSHLVWSNLYKISPWERGNPGEGLCKAQMKTCRELLRAEINFFKPRRLLFITGGWVNDFKDILGMEKTLNWHNIVEAKEEVRNSDDIVSKSVVARRPEGETEERWVQEVVAAFEELGAGRARA